MTDKVVEVYLGSGAYTRFEHNGVTVMANSHVTPTDTVWLDEHALDEFIRIYNEMKENKKDG